MKIKYKFWTLFAVALVISSIVLAVEPVNPTFVDSFNRFSSYYSATMSGTALKSTIQNPAGSSKRIFLEAVSIRSSVAGTFNIEVAGSIASATAGTINSLNTSVASSAGAFTASNVGTGTVIGSVVFDGADTKTVILSGTALASGAGTTHNITVVPQFTSGVIAYTWKFAEMK